MDSNGHHVSKAESTRGAKIAGAIFLLVIFSAFILPLLVKVGIVIWSWVLD